MSLRSTEPSLPVLRREELARVTFANTIREGATAHKISGTVLGALRQWAWEDAESLKTTVGESEDATAAFRWLTTRVAE